MRLERLHLLRYGAFTDREILFRPNAAVHIVYGANEAGKSTTLAALSDLLFGFEHAISQAFQHDAATLRICATLSASDGSRLAFRRRRGRAKTLLEDADAETALRDDALAPFIGGLNRHVFEHAFGLDSRRLEAGANAMLASDGELGGTLLAASSGLTGLRELRAQFEDDAGELYAPRASKKKFNALKDEWDAARQKARESELRAGDWKALNAEIAALNVRHEEVHAKRRALMGRQGELKRLKQILPVMRELDAGLRKRREFDDLVKLPEGFWQTLSKALDLQASAASACQAAREEMREAQDALSNVTLDEAVLKHAKGIGALHARIGDYLKTQTDMPRVEAEHRELQREIEDRTRRLGLDPSALNAAQPTDAALVLAETLSQDGRRLAQAAATIATQLLEERNEEADLAQKAPAGHLTEPKPLRDRFAALKDEIEAVSNRPALDLQFRAERRRIDEDAKRLTPSVADIATLTAAPLPSGETIQRQGDRLTDLDKRIARLLERGEDFRGQIERNRREIEALERIESIPTKEAILAARQERDAAFAPIAASLTASETERPSDPAALVGRVREQTKNADRLADLAIADADIVQRHGALDEQIRTLGEDKADLQTQTAELQAERERAHADFAAPFEALGLTPIDPTGMAGWLREVQRLLVAHREITDRAETLHELQQREDRLKPALVELCERVFVEQPQTLSVSALVTSFGRRIDEISDAWTASRGHAELVRNTRQRIERLQTQQAANLEAQDQWREAGDGAFAALGLEPGATPEQADAVVALWRELPGLDHERRNRNDRVKGMQRDAERFKNDVGALVAAVAPSLGDLPYEQAAETLREMSDLASVAKARLDERSAAFERARRDADLRRDDADLAEAHLARLLEQCPQDAEPTHLVEKIKERDAIEAAIRQTRMRLADLAPDQAEETIRAALDPFDPSEAELELHDLAARERDLESEASEIYADLRERQAKKDALGRGAGAEAAVFEQKSVEAGMLDLARRWAVLKIASSLVSATLEHHRQTQDAPLMRRAGERLARLTDGAFTALSQEFGDNDRAELIAVRTSGERLRIADLSDGTRDQLYLALRLAFIEDYASRNEPIPFIGDDIFQTFDDARTAAGLATLADASTHMQPILFAHHRAVVEIAREQLGAAADIIEI